MPLASVVIVTYNSSDCIQSCIESILQHIKYVFYEIIVVDNCSTDKTIEIVQRFKQVKLLTTKKNLGFASACNIGGMDASGEFIIILNPDIQFTSDTNIAGMIDFYQHTTGIGVLGPRLFYSNGNIQESARAFPEILTFLIRGMRLEKIFADFQFYKKQIAYSKSEIPIEVDWILGAFLFVRKSVIESLNYFDKNYFMYYEDIDLCWRAKKTGYKIIYNPRFSAIHEYKRESTKKIISKIKITHLLSFLRFSLKRMKYKR